MDQKFSTKSPNLYLELYLKERWIRSWAQVAVPLCLTTFDLIPLDSTSRPALSRGTCGRVNLFTCIHRSTQPTLWSVIRMHFSVNCRVSSSTRVERTRARVHFYAPPSFVMCATVADTYFLYIPLYFFYKVISFTYLLRRNTLIDAYFKTRVTKSAETTDFRTSFFAITENIQVFLPKLILIIIKTAT